MAAAERNVPRLHQLVRRAVKEKCSVSRIVQRIEDSLNNVYQARGYTKDDNDMALLVLRLDAAQLTSYH